MGCVLGKFETDPSDNSIDLKAKIRLLENEIMVSGCKREQECRWGEQMFQAFMDKELEWKRERKRWKAEMEEVRMRLAEKEERIRRLEKEASTTLAAQKGGGKDLWQGVRASLLVQHMREEHARREEAVEKWKRLYLAIKTELDDLILTTSQGERLWWGAEEEHVMDSLQKELNAKEETIEAMRNQISALTKEGANRDREVDILRQSLRIVSNTAQQPHLSNNLCTFDTESNKTKRCSITDLGSQLCSHWNS